MTTVNHKTFFGELMAELSKGNLGAFEKATTEDVTVEFPQSGEVFNGQENMMGSLVYPGGDPQLDPDSVEVSQSDAHKVVAPTFTVVRLEGAGDSGTAIFKQRYPDGSVWWVVLVYHLSDTLMDRCQFFFAPMFDPPEWRTPYVEHYEEPLPDSEMIATLGESFSGQSLAGSDQLSAADNVALFEQAVAALNKRDFDSWEQFFTVDCVNIYPQSGEVVSGRHNLRAIAENPGDTAPQSEIADMLAEAAAPHAVAAPTFSVVKIDAAGNSGTAIIKMRYGSGPVWWQINLYNRRPEGFDHMISFLAPAFEAPEWRKPFAE